MAALRKKYHLSRHEESLVRVEAAKIGLNSMDSVDVDLDKNLDNDNTGTVAQMDDAVEKSAALIDLLRESSAKVGGR